jgi:hypothetical protein
MVTNTILHSLVIGNKVGPWICEFCDSQWPPLQERCGSCKNWKGGKRSSPATKDTKEKTVSNNKGKKRGRKSKSLTPVPGQDVNIPLVVGGALAVGDTTFSPLTVGLNANESSTGPSIGMNSYDDATIGDNTVAQETNDELIRMLDDDDANEVGDSVTSDAEDEGYDCVVSFKDVMKEVELEWLCFDANEIESGVEVDDNDAFVCEVKDNTSKFSLYGAPPGWLAPSAPDDWNPNVNINCGEPRFEDVDNHGGWSNYTFRPMFEPKGGTYICHAMPAGAVPVPINALTGKRESRWV